MTEDGTQFRLLPEVTDRSRHFWTGGEHGELRILRCQDCGYYLHPPVPICPKDQSRNVAPEAVSGRATLVSYTINHQRWVPQLETPFTIGLVSLPEQPELRLTTNIVNCEPASVFTGMAVQVLFEHRRDEEGDLWIPLFEPAREA
jgi:uncharacterized OB-fold protein